MGEKVKNETVEQWDIVRTLCSFRNNSLTLQTKYDERKLRLRDLEEQKYENY